MPKYFFTHVPHCLTGLLSSRKENQAQAACSTRVINLTPISW